MKKTDLIDKLYEEFEEDKEVIKQNLLLVTNNIELKILDDDLEVKLNIVVKRRNKDEDIKQ